jgi:hypothetical protein
MESLPHKYSNGSLNFCNHSARLLSFSQSCFALDQLTENERFVDKAQQFFAFTPQAKIKQKFDSHLLYGQVDSLKPS